MKASVHLACLLLPSLVATGQAADPPGNKQVQWLLQRIESVEKENRMLNLRIRNQDSIAYCQVRQEIFVAFSGTPSLEFDFKNTTDKIAVTGLFTRLMQANNPSSDVLGFRFNDVILSACEKNFIMEIKDEKEKKRFGEVIGKIIGNPLVTSLANTNPVTSVVAAIITTVAGFSSPKLEVKADGNRIRGIDIENQDVVGKQQIQAFRNELQVYIDFYDALMISSNNYLNGLDQLSMKYYGLMQSVKTYRSGLYGSIGDRSGNILQQLSTLLPDPEQQILDFNLHLGNRRVLDALAEARNFPSLQQAVQEFQREYNHLLAKFLTDHAKVLLKAKEFPAGSVDPVRIDSLVADITSFLASQGDGNIIRAVDMNAQ